MKKKYTAQLLGTIVALFLTLFYSFMGVIVRQLVVEGFSSLQTAFVRAFFSFFFLGILFLYKNKKFLKRFFEAPKKDILLLLWKGVLGFGVGAGFFSLAMLEGNYLSITAMYIIPFVAIFGILLNGEKLNRVKGVLLFLSLYGAFLLIVKDTRNIHFGIGEARAFISAAGLGLSMISRKWFSDYFTNKEITLGTVFFGSIILLVVSLIQGWGVSIEHMSLLSWGYMIGGGILLICVGVMSNFVFSTISDIKANIILNMELVRGFLIGMFLYHEAVVSREIFGSVLILVSSLFLVIYNYYFAVE